jgi:PTS system mannose-specific IIA component
MVKALLITHGNLGQEMIETAKIIVEAEVDIDFIRFDWDESDGNETIKKIEQYIATHRDTPIVIFTDMFGGSPANIALRFINDQIDVLTGVNLPTILKYLSYAKRGLTFSELCKILKKGSIDGISLMSEYIGRRKNDSKNR